MSFLRTIGFLLIAALSNLVGSPSSVIAAGIDLTEIGFEFDGSPWTLGWKFSVTTPYTVNSLGVYDSSQDGLVGPAQVALWLASGGSPLVQTTVASGIGGELDGYFRYANIAPTLLNPGTEYIVGSYLSGNLATALFGGNGTVDPHINVIDVRYSPEGSAASEFPGLTDPGTEGAAFLGGNFRGALSPVPLPPAVWLFGSGVAGLLFSARKRFNRSI